MHTTHHFIVEDAVINSIVRKHLDKPGSLLTTLEEVQEANPLKFLPQETLASVSLKTNIPLTQVYSVATFYSFFNLRPQGRHSIVVCRGTACHTKGSRALLHEVGPILGFKYDPDEGEPSFTTSDFEYTIRTVACFGQCAQAPVVSIDGIIHSYVNTQKLLKILRLLSRKSH